MKKGSYLALVTTLWVEIEEIGGCGGLHTSGIYVATKLGEYAMKSLHIVSNHSHISLD